MKGMLYRELYLARKTYLVGGVSVILFVLLGVLIRLSLRYGNLADLEEEAFEFVDVASYYAFSYLPLVLLGITCASDGGVILSDYRSKWCLYSYTLPMKESAFATVKFVMKAGFLVLTFLLGMGNLALFAGLSGKAIEGGSIKILLIVLLVVSMISVAATPMTIRYKSANAVIIRIVIVVIIAFIGFMFWFKSRFAVIQAGNDGTLVADELADLVLEMVIKFRDVLSLYTPVLLLLTFVLGYLATVRQLKKREIM